MNVRCVLNAIKELISTSPAAVRDDGGASNGLIQCLQANLRSYQELLQKEDTNYCTLQARILHFKDAYRLADATIVGHTQDTKSQAHNTYREFIPEGLSLLLVLDEILCSLHEEDTTERIATQAALSSSDKKVPRAPKSLLSISDQKSVSGLAQFIVSLGIFPYLSPPLDALLRVRLSHAKLVEKCHNEKICSDERACYLYKTCSALVQCFGNPVLGPNLLSQHLSDVLVALLQICYAPNESGLSTRRRTDSSSGHHPLAMHQRCTPGDINLDGDEVGSPDKSGTVASLSVSEREWCMETLHELLNKTYQPLVVRELLAIQQISSLKGQASGGTAKWLQRTCGQLLSQRLLHKNGVQHVLRGVFEATVTGGTSADDSSGDWKKCQAVAQIISSCPSGVSTIEDYYSLICPQVLALFRLPKDGIGRQFLRVAVATVSAMMMKQRELGVVYLFRPIMQPLLQLAGEEAVANEDLNELCESLETCMEDLCRVCSIVEPSSIFLAVTLPYLPLIFDLWWASTTLSNADFSTRCREVIVRVLKPATTATIVNFLQSISGMKSKDTSELKEVHFGFNISCTEGADGAHGLTIEAQSEMQAVQNLDTERMEKVGSCILDLLQRDFSSSPVLGVLFVQCLKHLASLLCKKTGYTLTREELAPSTPPTTKMAELSTSPSPTFAQKDPHSPPPPQPSTDSSLLLLECEDSFNSSFSSSGSISHFDLLSQHTQAYHNALVLYIAAALCEHMSNEVLQSVQLPLLLEAVATIVGCHAHFVSSSSDKATNIHRVGSQSPGSAGSSGKKGVGGVKGLLLVAAGGPNLDDLPGSSITLSIVFGLLSAVLGGGREIERKDRPLLNSMLHPLETISAHYPDPELAKLAGDLKICIATLGAVWSEEMQEKAAEMKFEGTFTKKVKSTAKLKRKTGGSGEKGRKSSRSKARSVVEEGGKSQLEKSGSESRAGACQVSEKKIPTKKKGDASLVKTQGEAEAVNESFQQALSDLADPLIPVQGHGLISLTRLIEAKDTETLSNVHQILSIFQNHLSHPDTYIYLAAINGLVALASLPTYQHKVIATLCQGYALLPGPPASTEQASLRVNKDTGQLKSASLSKSSVHSDQSLKSSIQHHEESAKSHDRSSELRMKLGEALVRVAKETNELIPHYMEQIMAAVMSNARDPDPMIRASSLSNLADVAALAKYSMVPFQNEILSCVKHILETDGEVKVRQAALTMLKLLIKGLSQDALQVLGDSLLEVYRLLKRVEGMERDELTRAHAQAALGELDSVMRTFLFPEPNSRPHKKITILN